MCRGVREWSIPCQEGCWEMKWHWMITHMLDFYTRRLLQMLTKKHAWQTFCVMEIIRKNCEARKLMTDQLTSPLLPEWITQTRVPFHAAAVGNNYFIFSSPKTWEGWRVQRHLWSSEHLEGQEQKDVGRRQSSWQPAAQDMVLAAGWSGFF